MSKKLDFKTFKEEALKDPAFRMEYESLRSEFELIRQSIKAHKKHLNNISSGKKTLK